MARSLKDRLSQLRKPAEALHSATAEEAAVAAAAPSEGDDAFGAAKGMNAANEKAAAHGDNAGAGEAEEPVAGGSGQTWEEAAESNLGEVGSDCEKIAEGAAAEPSSSLSGLSPATLTGTPPATRYAIDGSGSSEGPLPLAQLSGHSGEGQAEAALEPTPESKEWSAIGGAVVTNEWGSYIKRVCRYPLDGKVGHFAIGELSGCASVLNTLVPERQAGVDHRRLLFFDTETTGLGIGAGNVPFMIGIGYYTETELVVEQLFIRHPAEEMAMLSDLSARLDQADIVVSYNGKSFDWPILKNRYIMNRLPFPKKEPLQLDFLHPSRNLWKHTLPSCRLSSIETERLGIERFEDVPGSLAPTLYFQYLAMGSVEPVKGVFLHNEQDVVALAGLAIHFALLLDGRGLLAPLPAEEVFRQGLWLARIGSGELAERAFSHLLDRPEQELAAYYTPLAGVYKKLGKLPLAEALWLKAVALRGAGQAAGLAALEPYIELSMYYEHKQRDYASALEFAEQAVQLAGQRLSLTRRDPKQQQAYDSLLARAERIARKLQAHGGGERAASSRTAPRRPEPNRSERDRPESKRAAKREAGHSRKEARPSGQDADPVQQCIF